MRRRLLIVLVLSLAIGAAIALQAFWDPDGWPRHEEVKAALEKVESHNERTRERIQEIRREVEALRQRTEVQERVVRHELGYIRPGEVVVEIDEEADPEASPPPQR